MAATELREADARRISRSVVRFGVTLIAAFVAACILAERVVIDFGLLVVFLLASQIRDRSAGAAKVAAGLVGAYCLCLMGAGFASLNYSVLGWWPAPRFPRVGVGGGLMAAAAAFLLAAWGTAIVLQLIAAIRRRISPGHCRGCGYDLRESRERCPECGRPIDPDILATRAARAALASWSDASSRPASTAGGSGGSPS